MAALKLGLALLVAAAALLEPVAAQPQARQLSYVGSMERYVARYEDTLVQIARDQKFGYVELLAANPEVDPWLPGAGRDIVLPGAHLLPQAPQRGIVINLSEMRLYFFPKEGGTPETFPIGIGREGQDTPVAVHRIVRKQADPTWYPPASVRAVKPHLPTVVPPGPDNPLGRFALYINDSLIRIHGTNQPLGVGRRVSFGCIRMYPEDIEYLFPKVPVGTQVNFVDQPVKFGWIDGELYMEVHPSKNQADQLEMEGRLVPEIAEGTLGRAEEAAGDEARRIDVPTILKAALERRGYPIRVTR